MHCDKCIVNKKFYPFLIAQWDEELGPIVCPNKGLFFGLSSGEIQNLIDNLFMSAVSIYGSEMKVDRPAIITVPVYSISMDAILYFDALEQKFSRGGQQFIMFALFSQYVCSPLLEKLKEIFRKNVTETTQEKLAICSVRSLISQDLDKLIIDLHSKDHFGFHCQSGLSINNIS
ncbi:MAG: hypothetical protein ACXAC7_17885 [Candidatus Hodarchaeales archaeon]